MRFGVKATIVVLVFTYLAILGAALVYGPRPTPPEPERSVVVDPMGCI